MRIQFWRPQFVSTMWFRVMIEGWRAPPMNTQSGKKGVHLKHLACSVREAYRFSSVPRVMRIVPGLDKNEDAHQCADCTI